MPSMLHPPTRRHADDWKDEVTPLGGQGRLASNCHHTGLASLEQSNDGNWSAESSAGLHADPKGSRYSYNFGRQVLSRDGYFWTYICDIWALGPFVDETVCTCTLPVPMSLLRTSEGAFFHWFAFTTACAKYKPELKDREACQRISLQSNSLELARPYCRLLKFLHRALEETPTQMMVMVVNGSRIP